MAFNSFGNLLIAGIYYVLVAIMSFFSIFGVFIFIRYGKSVFFTLIISALYALFYLKILAASLATLHSLLS